VGASVNGCSAGKEASLTADFASNMQTEMVEALNAAQLNHRFRDFEAQILLFGTEKQKQNLKVSKMLFEGELTEREVEAATGVKRGSAMTNAPVQHVQLMRREFLSQFTPHETDLKKKIEAASNRPDDAEQIHAMRIGREPKKGKRHLYTQKRKPEPSGDGSDPKTMH
jgi:hypothetical protein